MTYTIIQPPFGAPFRERSQTDLAAYRNWFEDVVPLRAAELREAIHDTNGFERWEADLTPDSLSPLGQWLYLQVETRERTKEELARLTSRLSLPVGMSTAELTDRSYSLAIDVGIYFGRVVVENIAGTGWEQFLKKGTYADYGHMVVVGRARMPLNPIRIAVNLAYAMAAREQSGERLRDLYGVWADKLSD